ncbi:MAG: hydroxymethylglutaryl-CoA lyase [Chloroflexi bacterium]|nr:hydroxymethylglutaryl-CoA lyase [Chloroflexota bacterium]
MEFPARVTMREVGTRDGIQSLGAFVPTEQKVEMANRLARTGLTRIEVTSFVHPKAVPQMADAAEVMAGIERAPGIAWEPLVPNVRGAERAIEARADRLVVVLAASDTFNRKNIRMSVGDSLRVIREIVPRARSAGLPVSAGIATSFGCPYEGDVPEERLLEVVGRLRDVGVEEIILADTTGMANPLQVERTVGRLRERWSMLPFGLHFHNTRGMGLANVVAGLRVGVTTYDASIGGIGGCPFAPKATGNVSTEDVVHMLHEMGIETGIDLDALIACANRMAEILGSELPGQVMKAGPRNTRHAA